jgi:hypothetical protein
MQVTGPTPQLLLPADDNRIGFYAIASSNSISAGGITATGPTAGTIIVKLANIPPGIYSVTVQTAFTVGTPTSAADGTNFSLLLGGTTISTTFATPIAVNQPTFRTIQVTVLDQLPVLSTTTGLILNVIANATAGVGYLGELTAVPLTPVYLGLDPGVIAAGRGQSSGWPVGTLQQFYAMNQEVWVMTPQTGTVEIRVIEVVRRDQAWSGRPYEGD